MGEVVSFETGEKINYAAVPKQQSGVLNCIELINQRNHQIHNIVIAWTEINGDGVKICYSTMNDFELRGIVAFLDDFASQQMDIETWEAGDDEEE